MVSGQGDIIVVKFTKILFHDSTVNAIIYYATITVLFLYHVTYTQRGDIVSFLSSFHLYRLEEP